MELEIKLSINKKAESQHNTFILKWNPIQKKIGKKIFYL